MLLYAEGQCAVGLTAAASHAMVGRRKRNRAANRQGEPRERRARGTTVERKQQPVEDAFGGSTSAIHPGPAPCAFRPLRYSLVSLDLWGQASAMLLCSASEDVAAMKTMMASAVPAEKARGGRRQRQKVPA